MKDRDFLETAWGFGKPRISGRSMSMEKNSVSESARQVFSLGDSGEAVRRRQNAWAETEVDRRIWQKDGTVWVPDREEAARTPELTNRLGWLELPEVMRDEVTNLARFAEGIVHAGFRHVVLLGMGGSSLAPEVFMNTFGNAPGYPRLIVLDSTHPASVSHVADSLDLTTTLFLVSSKSGGTIETLSFFKFFYHAMSDVKQEPGQNFVAITDPGSRLEALATAKKLRHVFSSPPEVGGRYSALTYFGLVPASLIGMDLDRLLDRAMTMAQATHHGRPVNDNPGLALGAAMGELARAGRDKITLVASPGIRDFPVWVEQLVAESTGKRGTGIVPVVGESVGHPAYYGDDRFFVYLRLEGENNGPLDKDMDRLEAAGHPVVRIRLTDPYDLGGEFFRWEMATAAAGAVLGINPFDQPDVEAAKAKARDLMAAFEKPGRVPADTPAASDGAIEVYGGRAGGSLGKRLTDFLEQTGPGDYVALMGYLPRTDMTDATLGQIRLALRDRLKVATTVGYGPRFLHSTGQLHKGGANKGLFIQITHEPEKDVPIPGEPYTFGTLIAAQAMGDYRVLAERGRRVIRCHLKGDMAAGLKQLEEVFAV
jgi:glucose-6-phosphate isomerase